MPDLAEIAATSGLPPRKLRYVLDHGLLPGGAARSRGRGAARSFEPFECFGRVIAAVMLEAGLRRATVRDCLAALVRSRDGGPETIPLYRAHMANGPTWLEGGDGSYARLVGPGGSSVTGATAQWLPLGKQTPAPAGYAPLVRVTLDVAQIRGKVWRPDQNYSGWLPK
jgi:hypothetical protein